MAITTGGLGKPAGFGRPNSDPNNPSSPGSVNNYLARLFSTVTINQRAAAGSHQIDPENGFQGYSYNKRKGVGIFNGIFAEEEGIISDEKFREEIIEQSAYKGTELYGMLHNRHGKFYNTVKAAMEFFPKPNKTMPRDPIVGEFVDEVQNNLSLYRYCCSYACILFSATLADYALAGRTEELVSNEKIWHDAVFNNFINVLGLQFLSWLEYHPDAITLQARLSPDIRMRIEKFENVMDTIHGAMLSISIGNAQVPFPWKKGALNRIIERTQTGSPAYEMTKMYADSPSMENDSWPISEISAGQVSHTGKLPDWLIEHMKRQENINFDDQPIQKSQPFEFTNQSTKTDTWELDNVPLKDGESDPRLVELAKRITSENRLDFDPKRWFKPVPNTDWFTIHPDYFTHIATALTYDGENSQSSIYIGDNSGAPRLTMAGFVNDWYYGLDKETNKPYPIHNKDEIKGPVYRIKSDGNLEELVSEDDIKLGLVSDPGIGYERSGWACVGTVPLVKFDWVRGIYTYENIYVGEDNVGLTLTNPELVIPKLDVNNEKAIVASFDQYIAEISDVVKTKELSQAHTECNELKTSPKVIYGNAPIEIDTNEDLIKTVRDISTLVETKMEKHPDVLVLPIISHKSVTIDDIKFNYERIEKDLPFLITGSNQNLDGGEFFKEVKQKLKIIGSKELTTIVSNHITNVINRWLIECRFYSDNKEDNSYLAVDNIIDNYNDFMVHLKTHDPSTLKSLHKLYCDDFLVENLTLFASKETQRKYISKSIKYLDDKILRTAKKAALEKSVLLEKQYAFVKINPMKPLEYSGRVVIEGSHIPEMRWLLDKVPKYLEKHFNRQVPLLIGFSKDTSPKAWMINRSAFCRNKFSLRRVSFNSPIPLFKPMQ